MNFLFFRKIHGRQLIQTTDLHRRVRLYGLSETFLKTLQPLPDPPEKNPFIDVWSDRGSAHTPAVLYKLHIELVDRFRVYFLYL